MRAAALAALLWWQVAAGDGRPMVGPEAMQYERAISVAAGRGQACALLDAENFPHASPALTDLRIFPTQGGVAAGSVREIPYAITLSEAMGGETEPARVLNLRQGDGSVPGGAIVFDLEMPDRPYTGVTLNLDPQVHDFIATATVSGSDSVGNKTTEAMGLFTLFDLAAQHLSRDTTLPLPESSFHYLHVVLSVSPAPGSSAAVRSFVPAMVQGAKVPPSREAQILYSTVAETSSVATVGSESRASFEVAPRVPVERISIVLAPGFRGNFSRNVRVTAVAGRAAEAADVDDRAPLPEIVSGGILRVHMTEAGREIRRDQLSIPAILGANLQRPAKVEVAIENGDNQPLPIAAVRLEMRQRKLCFEVPAAGGEAALFYGDPKLLAPAYDYERQFVGSEKPLVAQFGEERPNPTYRVIPDERAFTDQHPEVLWIALIVVISALGSVALKSARNVGSRRG
jgi:hypothetical protein